jgi:hypothetical protein
MHRNSLYCSCAKGLIEAGEVVIYAGFALASWHWEPFVVLAGWFLYFVRNMRRKDESMSRHPEFAAYKDRTGMFLPSLGRQVLRGQDPLGRFCQRLIGSGRTSSSFDGDFEALRLRSRLTVTAQCTYGFRVDCRQLGSYLSVERDSPLSPGIRESS